MNNYAKAKKYLFLTLLSTSTIIAQHTPYWLHKVAMFSILPNSEHEIIFLGDSITDRCEWFELFSNPNVKNRGLSGDKTSGVLDRLFEVTQSKPDKIFIMIGVNDLRHGVSIDSILTNYKKIIKTINLQSPKTEIIIESVLPVNNKIGKPKTTNLKVDNLNGFLRNLSQKFNIKYVDISSRLKDVKGRLDEKYSKDGLHINGKGYLVWKSVIEKYLIN